MLHRLLLLPKEENTLLNAYYALKMGEVGVCLYIYKHTYSAT